MNEYTTGLIVSLIVCVVLHFFFTFEEKRGSRFIPVIRTRLDFLVLRATHFLHTTVDVRARELLRQLFHYILHAVLRMVLVLNKQWEKSIQSMIRANKTIAKNAERERKTRNKLQEVALHKMETALTEEEKKLHRDQSLEG